MYATVCVYGGGRRGKRALSARCGRLQDIFKTGRTKLVAAALEGKSIKIPLRSLGEYSAGIIVQFARITRISRVFLSLTHEMTYLAPSKKKNTI